MIKIEKNTRKKQDDVLNKAESYFGPGGKGLQVTLKEESYVCFEGGGGHVTVRYKNRESGKDRVEVEAREYEYQAREFIEKI